jgi:hypothetical protein
MAVKMAAKKGVKMVVTMVVKKVFLLADQLGSEMAVM